MLNISQKLINEVIEYCMTALPKEACGVFIGKKESKNNYQIDRFISITNIASDPEKSFEMDPSEWVSLIYAYNNTNRQIVGIMHTHPNTAAVPSHRDQLTQWKEIPSYWIISLSSNESIDIQAFQFTDSSYQKLAFNIQMEI